MSSVEIINSAREWFSITIAANHVRNTRKLANPSEFNINPFTVGYLANFLDGKATTRSIAKALIYPRALGTSITTSFGTNLQSFISDVLSAYGSTTSGIDMEYISQNDARRKYCQLKAGPQTINKDDVESIHGHFNSIRNLARTNNLNITGNDLIVGVMYGEIRDLSSHYKRLVTQYHHPVLIGNIFWTDLTGEADFYDKLVKEFMDVAADFDGTEVLEETILELSKSDQVKEILEQLT